MSARGTAVNVLLFVCVAVLLYAYLTPDAAQRRSTSAPGVAAVAAAPAVAERRTTPIPALAPIPIKRLAPVPTTKPKRADGANAERSLNDTIDNSTGYPIDENEVEATLPPMVPVPPAVIDTASAPIVNDDETMAVRVAIGVLTAPALMRTRLIPLLETSLRHERDVFVFYLDNATTKPGRDAIDEYVRSVNRSHEINIVALPALADMKMSLRNSWVDVPAALYMHAARPNFRWFGIMDDDTYLLMNAVRRILIETQRNASMVGVPAYLGTPLTWGACTGWRVIRDSRTGVRRIMPTRPLKPVSFVCGGSGVFFDNLAAEAIQKRAPKCLDNHFHPAGDVRLGACMNETGITIVARRELFRDTVFRAIGDKHVHDKYLFPASFHRFRYREWFYAVGAVESARPRNELVTWGDLQTNFPIGPKYWHSLFYPQAYPNYTQIFGLRTLSPMEKKRERILKKLGYPPCKHEDAF